MQLLFLVVVLVALASAFAFEGFFREENIELQETLAYEAFSNQFAAMREEVYGNVHVASDPQILLNPLFINATMSTKNCGGDTTFVSGYKYLPNDCQSTTSGDSTYSYTFKCIKNNGRTSANSYTYANADCSGTAISTSNIFDTKTCHKGNYVDCSDDDDVVNSYTGIKEVVYSSEAGCSSGEGVKVFAVMGFQCMKVSRRESVLPYGCSADKSKVLFKYYKNPKCSGNPAKESQYSVNRIFGTSTDNCAHNKKIGGYVKFSCADQQ